MAGGAAALAAGPKAAAVDSGAKRPVVILGSTSALMRGIAAECAARGHGLILAARDMTECQAIAADLTLRFEVDAMPIDLDAEALDTHEEFFQQCIERARDGLAGVVFGIGFMEDQKRAQVDRLAARRTIDINLTAAVSLLERFADLLEDQHDGFIIGIGSVAGDRGRQSNYLYGAAKAGLAAYLAGLRNRLQPSSVHVLTVKPGFLDTKMTWGLPGVFLVCPPEKAAAAVLRALEKGRNVAYIPAFWWVIMGIIRHIPEPIFKRMKL